MSQGSSTRGVDVAVLSTPLTRSCRVCSLPIPQKRLEATNGKARECVGCLNEAGDVPRLKRFDEYMPSGDRVETLFTQDARIEQQIAHLNTDVASDAAYEAASGETTEIDPRETEQIIQAVTEDEELDEMVPPLSIEDIDALLADVFNEVEEIPVYNEAPKYYAATA